MKTVSNSSRESDFIFRIIITFSTILWCLVFIYIYKNWAAPNYFYLGLSHYAQSDNLLILSSLFVVFSSFFLSTRIRKFSDIFNWVVFTSIYCPGMLVVSMQGIESFEADHLVLSLFISMQFMLMVPSILNFSTLRVRGLYENNIAMAIFLGLWGLSMLLILYLYRGNIGLANFDTIYQQRDLAAAVGVSGPITYILPWLQTAINPWLIVVGILDKRRRWFLALGIIGQLIAFAVFAGKIIIASLVLMLVMSIFLRQPDKIKTVFFSIGNTALMCVILLYLILNSWEVDNWTSLLYMRVYGIQGAMIGVYSDFFTNNPHTYYSHVKGVSSLIKYPYIYPLGVEVGFHIAPSAEYKTINANSHFWSHFGVIIIGLFIGLILSVMNRIASRDKLLFTTIASIPFLLTVANVSFFTSLFTGGGGLLFLLILFFTPSYSKDLK